VYPAAGQLVVASLLEGWYVCFVCLFARLLLLLQLFLLPLFFCSGARLNDQ